MKGRDEYRFANLVGNPALIDDIVALERKMKRELGQPITLIAYARNDGQPEDASCRSGLDG